MTGRPSDYSDDLAAEICRRLAEGDSLRTICAADDTPSCSTVFRWLADDAKASFREQYARAREAQADHMAEDIIEIADDSTNDTVLTEKGEHANTEWIARSRLRVDARKWLMSKLAPKKYGEKVTNEVVGANGGPVQITRIELVAADGNAKD